MCALGDVVLVRHSLSVLRVSTLPPLCGVSLDCCLFGLLSLVRACFHPFFEVKGQLKLLASYCEVPCKLSSTSRSVTVRLGVRKQFLAKRERDFRIAIPRLLAESSEFNADVGIRFTHMLIFQVFTLPSRFGFSGLL